MEGYVFKPPSGPGSELEQRERSKRDRARYFMGRENFIADFERLLETPPGERRIRSLFGMGGSGKTWLLEELRDRAAARGYLTAYADLSSGDCQDPDCFYLTLWRSLCEGNPSLLIETNEQAARYIHIIRREREEEPLLGAGAVPILCRALFEELPVVKGLIERKQKLFERNEDVFLKNFPAAMLKALQHDIRGENGLPRTQIALFLDTYERCPPTVAERIKELVWTLRGLAVIVIAGRESLLRFHLPWGEGWEAIIEEDEKPLPELTKDEIGKYLGRETAAPASADIEAARLIEATGGFAFLVTFVLETLGRQGLGVISGLGGLGAEVGEKKQELLKVRIGQVLEKMEPGAAFALKLAAFPRRCDGTLFSALRQTAKNESDAEEALKAYEGIARYSFMRRDGEWLRCHDILQAAVRDYWRQNERNVWRKLHERARDYFGDGKGLDYELEVNFHEYQLNPLSSWPKIRGAYLDLSGKEEGRRIADALLVDFSSYCGDVTSEEGTGRIIELFDNIDDLLSKHPRGNRSNLCLRRIGLLELALECARENRMRGKLQHGLGNAWQDIPTGDRVKNLNRAIECYQAALEVRTREAYPADWAQTMNALGIAWSDLPSGNRTENLEKAIMYFHAALEVFKREEYPDDWAMTKNNLGAAWSELPTGDRGENLNKAIECYEDALEVRTREAYPIDWATTIYNLGEALQHLPTGEQSENIKQAIECYLAAHEVYTRSDFPMDWAMIMNNLGEAWFSVQVGDRRENLDKAIKFLKNALELRTKQAFPLDFAETKHNLALCFLEDAYLLPLLERLGIALGHLEEACEVLSEDDIIHRYIFEERDRVRELLRQAESDKEK